MHRSASDGPNIWEGLETLTELEIRAPGALPAWGAASIARSRSDVCVSSLFVCASTRACGVITRLRRLGATP